MIALEKELEKLKSELEALKVERGLAE